MKSSYEARGSFGGMELMETSAGGSEGTELSIREGLEAAADGIELGADFGAQTLHGGNHGDGDEGRNESVFDQVLAGVVTEESLENLHRSQGYAPKYGGQ